MIAAYVLEKLTPHRQKQIVAKNQKSVPFRYSAEYRVGLVPGAVEHQVKDGLRLHHGPYSKP